MKYIYLIHWFVLHANGQEPMSQTFGIRDSAVSFYQRGVIDAKNTSPHTSPLGNGVFQCCTMDSTAVK
jgi:hypothetical protein